jgi:lysophospholipase L1-like esterase
MISRPDTLMSESFIERRDVIIDTFRRARELGDTNVYYIDGEGLFRGPYEDCCTVDGCHPNDLGMMKMAEGIGRVLERALRKTDFRGEDNE